MIRQVAALCVDPKGVYSGMPAVDLWDEARDARRYRGDAPVVAHPPCARWSVLASLAAVTGGPPPGEDGGVFVSVLASVRRCGGVLEHPANSAAWPAHGLKRPPSDGGWVVADFEGGWTCCVDQIDYGHPTLRKRTWLYAAGVALPKGMIWPNPNTPPDGRQRYGDGRKATGRVRGKARSSTPPAFAALLLSMARSVSR